MDDLLYDVVESRRFDITAVRKLKEVELFVLTLIKFLFESPLKLSLVVDRHEAGALDRHNTGIGPAIISLELSRSSV